MTPFGIREILEPRKLGSIQGFVAIPHLDLNITNVIDNNSLDDVANKRTQILQLDMYNSKKSIVVLKGI